MNIPSLRTGLATLAVIGGFAAIAEAQLPPTPVAPAVAPVNPVAPNTIQTVPNGIPGLPNGIPGLPNGIPGLPNGLPGVAGTPRVITWPGGSMIINGSEVIMRNTGPAGTSKNVIVGSGNGVGNRINVSNGGNAGGTTYIQGSRNGIGNTITVDPTDLVIDVDALLRGAGAKPAPVVVPAAPAAPAVAPAAPAAPAVAPPAAPVPVIPPAGDPAPAAPVVPAMPPAGPAMPPVPVMPPAPVAAPAGDPMAAPAPSFKGKDNAFWSKKQFSDAHDCNLYWDPMSKLWFRYGSEDDTYRPVANQPAAPVDMK